MTVDDTYGAWNVIWKTINPKTGEEIHNQGFPRHHDAQDFADELEDKLDAYDINIWDA